jgi:SAM-dependent methyltransferase
MSVVTCNACEGPVEPALSGVVDPQSRESFDVGVCARCGLGHTLPRPSDVGAYYGPAYYGGRHGATNAWCVRRRLRFVSSVVAPEPGDRLLDVGCGDGSFLLAAREAGWTVVGTEMRPAAARAAGLDVRTSVAEARDAGPFQCATFWHTLEHMEDPRGSLRRTASLVAPGGVVVVAVPDFGGLQASVFGRRWAHLDVPRHLYHFDERSLRQMLESLGLWPELTWHQELEYDLFGVVQSASNVVLPVPNVFYNRVTGGATGAGKGLEIGALVLGTALAVVAAPVVPLASALGRGGTLVVAARRPRALGETNGGKAIRSDD